MPTITATFGLDNSPFAKGMRDSEQLATRGASNISRQFESLFRRSPGRRAELAISGLVGDLSSGNLAGAVTNFGERLSGLGLLAGVGIGAGVALFIKLKEQIDETTKAEEALHAELAKPVSLQSGLSPDAIGQQIATLEKTTEEFAKKRDSFGQKVKNLGKDIALSFISGKSGTFGVAEAGDEAEVSAALKRESELSAARADAEVRATNARRVGLTASEREGELQKIALDAQQKRSKLFLERGLTKPGRSAVDLFKSAAAINQEESLSEGAVNQKFDVGARQVAAMQELANLSLKGASAEEQRRAELETEVGLIESQLAFNKQLTTEARKQLILEKTKAEARLKDFQLQQFLKPPQQVQQEQNIAQQHQRDLKRFDESKGLLNVRRDISGEVIGGTDPATGKPVSLPRSDPFGALQPRGLQFSQSEDDFQSQFKPRGLNLNLQPDVSAQQASRQPQEQGNDDVVKAIDDLKSAINNPQWTR